MEGGAGTGGVPRVGGRNRVPRRGLWSRRRSSRRGRLQYRHERLSGNLDGSILRRANRHPHRRRSRKLRNKPRRCRISGPFSTWTGGQRSERGVELPFHAVARFLFAGGGRSRPLRCRDARADAPSPRQREPEGLPPRRGRCAHRGGGGGACPRLGGSGRTGLCREGDVFRAI